MLDFKFLSDNDDVPLDEIVHEDYDGASWMFGRRENLDQYPHEIVVEYHNGIHSFLNNFPSGFIACILSITGPNGGRFHNHETQYEDGWGFDITNDLIRIEWVRFTH